MKRFITMIVAACAFLVASAQFPMVTLSHNGELSFFTDRFAFNEAVDSAKNGDTLFLSEGVFLLKNDNCSINKRLSIVGNGYGSYLQGSVSINMTDNPDSWMDAPLFDGVRLDDLTFYAGTTSCENLGVSEIRRTKIGKIYNGDAARDITYDKCHIEYIKTNYNWGTVMMKNSKIGIMDLAYAGKNVDVENCNINESNYYPHTMISSILNQESRSSASGNPTIINSVLRCEPTNVSRVYGCYVANQSLLDEDLESTVNLIENGYLGQDGVTEVGIYGGENPFSKNPSVPAVDTSNSSVTYDAENNSLDVNISIKAN